MSEDECRPCFEHRRFNEPHCEEHCDCVECEPRRLKKRVAQLESELATLREADGLEKRVREVLGERLQTLNITHSFGHFRARWTGRSGKIGARESGREYTGAEDLPSLLRAILEVEAKGG
jgi:hypothetical protein